LNGFPRLAGCPRPPTLGGGRISRHGGRPWASAFWGGVSAARAFRAGAFGAGFRGGAIRGDGFRGAGYRGAGYRGAGYRGAGYRGGGLWGMPGGTVLADQVSGAP